MPDPAMDNLGISSDGLTLPDEHVLTVLPSRSIFEEDTNLEGGADQRLAAEGDLELPGDEDETEDASDQSYMAIDEPLAGGNISSLAGAALQGETAHGIVRLLALVIQELSDSAAVAGNTDAPAHSAILCHDSVQHIRSHACDLGWGCGFRNAQMLLSCIRDLPPYREHLLRLQEGDEADMLAGLRKPDVSADTEKASPSTTPSQRAGSTVCASIPAIKELQAVSEQAWHAGYDAKGASHFKNSIEGSKRWIGTTDVYTMLTYMGIRVGILDLPKTTARPGENRRPCERLVAWIQTYFAESLGLPEGRDALPGTDRPAGAPIVRISSRPCLYLQQQGHSRTIIGIETIGDKVNLLTFDPSRPSSRRLKKLSKSPVEMLAASAKEVTAKESKTFRMIRRLRQKIDVSEKKRIVGMYRITLNSLALKDRYQLLYVAFDRSRKRFKA
ncbi:hypothetical protein E5Q_03905 [Mixia osmundae IAM 14324]|uniref:UFSP1/2/DUB catalytic domain-containing protein n=1 Tax=Mixia osmundae (strain CBS 9802 / IAM 14324 / JCM 22182 / KY 12970) TaxID=764103 RepID=G7E348_MIXOS|nr:hypothetical protein E5Q_03905 [Mixia osmundae IAM 14324]